ncbi:hypothetical protein AAVH_19682 [Aphelenchoides avenae]|nr:hypothetical protein AAVH_19682 [Aphelenchus avenae]
MSKRQNESNASVPSEGLIKRLKSAGGDVSRLEEFVESKDSSASVAAAFAVPLAGARSPSANESKLKVLPQETLLDILANLNRHGFDVLKLVNRALRSLICANASNAPRRLISLMFHEDEHVMATCPSDGLRRVPVIELPQYLPWSVIRKMIFRCGHTLTEEQYQALRPCRAHFAAEAVCEFRGLSMFPPNILYRALTEVFMCSTLVLANFSSFFHDRDYTDEQSMPTLPCFANCGSLQIDEYHSEFFDAGGALEWLLGTHATTAGVKHLSIGEIHALYWDDFLRTFIAAIEQQFIHATTPTSFSVDLLFFVGHSPAPDVGTTREHENTDMNERLTIVVDTGVRKPSGEPALKTKVTIQRKPTA